MFILIFLDGNVGGSQIYPKSQNHYIQCIHIIQFIKKLTLPYCCEAFIAIKLQMSWVKIKNSMHPLFAVLAFIAKSHITDVHFAALKIKSNFKFHY